MQTTSQQSPLTLSPCAQSVLVCFKTDSSTSFKVGLAGGSQTQVENSEYGKVAKRDVEKPIHRTLNKTTSAIFSANKRPTGVCLQS